MQTLYINLLNNRYNEFIVEWKTLQYEGRLDKRWVPSEGKHAGLTLLNIAAVTGSVTFLVYMIENGMEFTSEALIYSISYHRTEVVNELIKRLSADELNIPRNKTTALITAVKVNELDYVKRLVAAHVEIDYVDLNNHISTPALSYAKLTIAQWLISRGADPNFVDYSGHTPLSISTLRLIRGDASERTRWEWLLGRSNPNTNTINNPLVLATAANIGWLILALVQAGADPRITGQLHNGSKIMMVSSLSIAAPNVKNGFIRYIRAAALTPLQVCDLNQNSLEYKSNVNRLKNIAKALGLSEQESTCNSIRKYDEGWRPPTRSCTNPISDDGEDADQLPRDSIVYVDSSNKRYCFSYEDVFKILTTGENPSYISETIPGDFMRKLNAYWWSNDGSRLEQLMVGKRVQPSSLFQQLQVLLNSSDPRIDLKPFAHEFTEEQYVQLNKYGQFNGGAEKAVEALLIAIRRGADIVQIKTDIVTLTNQLRDRVDAAKERSTNSDLILHGMKYQLLELIGQSDKLRQQRTSFVGTRYQLSYELLLKKLTIAISDLSSCTKSGADPGLARLGQCSRHYSTADLISQSNKLLSVNSSTVVKPRINVLKQQLDTIRKREWPKG